MTKHLTILGSTGSIGCQALDVARHCGYTIQALSANRNVKLLAEQARAFSARTVVVAEPSLYQECKLLLADLPVKVLAGMEGLCEVASLDGVDTVLNALVGMVGIRPTVAAICAGKRLALANKETLVSGGAYIMDLAAERQVPIYPVDSEHSGLFQCLDGRTSGISKLVLTASGGPFWGYTREQLADVTVEQALTHPNWSMGSKLLIDCATMMNKGLELIEAVRLFSVRPEDVEIVVHRESIMHALVEFDDHTLIAQLSQPDMRLPIQYALTYPERLPSPVPRLSLSDLKALTFYHPDETVFTAMRLCRQAVARGGLSPAALNGANEQAVELFLAHRMHFTDLLDLLDEAGAYCLATPPFRQGQDAAGMLRQILDADAEARAFICERAAARGIL